MRTLLLTGAALALLAGSTAANAADIYAPAPSYGAVPAPAPYAVVPAPAPYVVVPPPPAGYIEGPPAQAVPGLVEAPPPPYAPLPRALAYPMAPHPFYPPAGYGPDPGWVYGGPPAVAYDECWWEGRHRVCAGRRW